MLYLLNRLTPGGEPFAGDLEWIVELDGFFLALSALDSGELHCILGEAEGRHSNVGTETDVKCGAPCYLVKDRASR